MDDDGVVRQRRAKWRKRAAGIIAASTAADTNVKKIERGARERGTAVRRVPKVRMPPEAVRRAVRAAVDGRRSAGDADKTLGALRYVPHAIMKLLENMPMPWEAARHVDVLYHVSGALTVVTETPCVVEPVFLAQWAAVWGAMRAEKKARPHFRRLRFPPFDDDEPALDYGAALLDAPLPPPIRPPATLLPNADMGRWLWDAQPLRGTGAVRGERYSRKAYRLRQATLLELHGLASRVFPTGGDANARYLFDMDAFLAAKALGVALPGGPRFEPPPGLPDPAAEDVTEFNDMHCVLVRVPLRTEHVVAHPFVHGACTAGVPLCAHHRPAMYYAPVDPSLPPYVFDERLHPISFRDLLVDEDLHLHAGQSNAEDVPLDGPYCRTDDSGAQLGKRRAGPLSSCDRQQAAACTAGNNFPLDGVSEMPAAFGRRRHTDADAETVAVGSAMLSAVPLYGERTGAALDMFHAGPPFQSRTGRLRRAVDVAAGRTWVRDRLSVDAPLKVRGAHARILKTWVGNEARHAPPGVPRVRRSLFRALAATRHFQASRLDWLEAGTQLVRQGRAMLLGLLARRGLSYLHLDHNFNLKPTRTLTTKERKRSRFGHAFHMVRELLRLAKTLVDAHAQHRLGSADAFQLADGLQYALAHVGQLTALYRYKYRCMRQVRMAKAHKTAAYARFRADGTPRGPGCGFWLPAWRTWLFFLRGTAPVLGRWLSGLLARTFEGRAGRAAKTVSSQRAESHYDLELRARFLRDVLDALPAGARPDAAAAVVRHMAEAWRCWKAGVPWDVALPAALRTCIERYVRARADWWVRHAMAVRASIAAGRVSDKTAMRKNAGRVARLWMRHGAACSASHVRDGPLLTPDEGVRLYTAAAAYVSARGVGRIPFPPVGHRHDAKLLAIALDGIRAAHASASRPGAAAREELALVDAASERPHDALAQIKRALLGKRVFRPVSVEVADDGHVVRPLFSVDAADRVADAYLDAYLWHEAGRRALFPPWVRPADGEPAPLHVHRVCRELGLRRDLLDVSGGSALVFVEVRAERLLERVDLALLGRLLRLVVDAALADYICARANAQLAYKDMAHRRACGVLPGLAFSAFVLQAYALLTLDVCVLGPQRALELGAGAPPGRHPVQVYVRSLDALLVGVRLSGADRAALHARHAASGAADALAECYPRRDVWPADGRMRHTPADVATGRAVFWALGTRVPRAVATLAWARSHADVYSSANPYVLFGLSGFEVRLLPAHRCEEQILIGGPAAANTRYDDDAPFGDVPVLSAPKGSPTWTIADAETNAPAAYVHLRVGAAAIAEFGARVRSIVQAGGSSTFAKVAARWNSVLLGLVAYFREAVACTPVLLDALVRAESRVQARIKLGLNTKMPSRFPPVVFYAPRELGGLGMLSMGHVLIPADDLRWAGQAEGREAAHFRAGLSHDEGALLPVLLRYVSPWDAEAADSARVWADYAARRAAAAAAGRALALDDVSESWERGVPRLATLFQRDRATLALDKGWRARQALRAAATGRAGPFWWTDGRHDGRLWALDAYRADVVQALGGIEGVLAHSLFRATGHAGWEGLFWERPAGHEDALAARRLTNAQRAGLSQIPNRRFVLWWSPTINRAAVYVGFGVQLDLTGVVLHGKLPTLKVALVHVFRGHLWQKIHEALVMDVCQALDREAALLGVSAVERLAVHPRKSYRLSSSAADVLLRPAAGRFAVSAPSAHAAPEAPASFAQAADALWVDVQLRWGDYDSHDAARYARARFLDYTTDAATAYPGPAGLLLAVDLAYGVWAAYGAWLPGLRAVLSAAMARVMRASPALFVLRERLRKALALQADPAAPALGSASYASLVAGGRCVWLADDGAVHRVAAARPGGAPRLVNGALVVLAPASGGLVLRVFDAGDFAGQSRVGQLARWRAAEAVSSLVRVSLRRSSDDSGGTGHTLGDLGESERTPDRNTRQIDSPNALPAPQEVVAVSAAFLDALSVHMLDYPNVALRPSGLALPLGGLLRHPRLAARLAAPGSHLLCVYDDWLARVSPHTAFSRLALVLRALLVDAGAAMSLLKLDAVPSGRLWPALSDSEWASVEVALRDAIIAAFCRKEGIPAAALTQSEVRDIVLGAEVRVSEERARAALQASAGPLAAPVVAETSDVHGERTLVAATTPYEGAVFSGRSDWRMRLASRAPFAPCDVFVARPARESAEALVLPRGLVLRLAALGDPGTRPAAYVYGRARAALRGDVRTRVLEVEAAVLPPQACGARGVSLFALPPVAGAHAALEGLSLLGIIVGVPAESRLLPLGDALVAARLARHAGVSCVRCVLMRVSPGSVSLSPFVLDGSALSSLAEERGDNLPLDTGASVDPERASRWLSTQEAAPLSAPVLLTARASAALLVPGPCGAWSHAFSPRPAPGAPVAWSLGVPADAFAAEHRPAHFLAACVRPSGASGGESVGFLAPISVLPTEDAPHL